MQPQNTFRSHAFCKPRYLDGQGDEAADKGPAWKGTVASRIRSLNDMNNSARTGQALIHSAQDLQDTAKSTRTVQFNENHGSGSLAGRTNPFVRRSPPRTLHTPSRPNLPPERVSHSNVPLRSPVPSVLVQRPTFFEDHNRATQLPTARETRSADPGSVLHQGFGTQQCGNHLRRAEEVDSRPGVSSGYARAIGLPRSPATTDILDQLESKPTTMVIGPERDAKEDASISYKDRRMQLKPTSPSVIGTRKSQPDLRSKDTPTSSEPATAQQNPRLRLEAPSPSALATRKSQPDLRSKDRPTPSVLEAERDQGYSLKAQRASSPSYVRSTSPSIGIGPRATPFGWAGRVRSVSPIDSGQAKSDRTGANARLRRIESVMQEIAITSTDIESTAHKIRVAVHTSGLLLSQSTTTPSEAKHMNIVLRDAVPQQQVARQKQTPLADAPSPAARMRKDTRGGQTSADTDGVSTALEVVHSLSSILAEHGAVIGNIINQLKTCAHKLNAVRNLSQQSWSPSRPSSSVTSEKVAVPDSASLPVTTQILAGSPTPPTSANDPLQLIADSVQPERDPGEQSGLNPKQPEEVSKKTSTEVYHAETGHKPHTFLADMGIDCLNDAQGTPLNNVANLPAELAADPVPSRFSLRPHLSTRYFNDGNSPVNSIFATGGTLIPTPPPSPPIPREDTPVRQLKSRLHNTPPISATPHSPYGRRYKSPPQGRTTNPGSPSIESSQRSSPTCHRNDRQSSSYICAKQGVETPTIPGGSSTATFLDLIRVTPAAYFPYQHLPSMRASPEGASSTCEELQQGSYCPMFQTQCDDPRGPIARVLETPPPPPPLFSIDPGAELGSGGDMFWPEFSAEPIDHRPSPDLTPRATRESPEPAQNQYLSPTTFRMSMATVYQRPSSTRTPTKDANVVREVLCPLERSGSITSESMNTMRPPRPKPPPRRAAQRASLVRLSSNCFSLPDSCPPLLRHRSSQLRTDLSRSSDSLIKPLRTSAPLEPQPPLTEPESPLFLLASASNSPLTMAIIGTVAHSYPFDRNLLRTPLALVPPPPGPRRTLLSSVLRSTPAPETKLAVPATGLAQAGVPNNDASDSPMSRTVPEQKEQEQEETTRAGPCPLSNSTSTTPATVPFPIPTISVQQPSASSSVAPSTAVSANSSSSPETSPSFQPPPHLRPPARAGGGPPPNSSEPTAASTATTATATATTTSTAPTTEPQDRTDDRAAAPVAQPPPPPPAPHQPYRPLNVPDRVRLLEDARHERMRILRATGRHWDAMRALGRDGRDGVAQTENWRQPRKGEARGERAEEGECVTECGESESERCARALLLLLGGPREQISSLREPWW